MAESAGAYRIGVDVGGTFTDFVLRDEATGRSWVHKAPSTPRDPSEAVRNGLPALLEKAGAGAAEIGQFLHATTVATNAIIQRRGAKTALVTTRGFRDVLILGRQKRYETYDLHMRKPEPLIPRERIFEVRERTSFEGEVLEPLDQADLEEVVARIAGGGYEAVAVALLHAYANPAHERAVGAALARRLPGVALRLSVDVSPKLREYERANTAVLNAYVQPIVQTYFGRLEEALGGADIRCAYAAMQSNGGTTSFSWAKEHPITLMESGPAAGCNGAAIVGDLCDEPRVIYLDIGGTTAKCTTIEDGTPKVTTEYRLEYSRTQFGYPLRVPVVDIVESGAGGGSIAWFDKAGLLKVGPVSAGADPGPACYGRGGTEPTVTDAKLITGVINATNFAGGQFDLDEGKARAAMEKIASGLGTDVVEAAVAVIRTVEANMINALKLVSIQRGHDPRDFALVVGGGGGPMHGAPLGRELGVKEIIVPLYPGLFSAWGMLATEPRRDFMQTVLRRAEEVEAGDVRAVFAGLREEAERYYQTDAHMGEAEIAYEGRIDLRYLGQEHPVTVLVDIESAEVQAILAAFHDAHEKTYTFRLDDTPVEFVTYRLTASAKVPRPEMTRLAADGRSIEAAARPARTADFAEDGRHEAAVYERDRLPPGAALAGPLIVEEATATTLVHPGQTLRVDDYGFLRITDA